MPHQMNILPGSRLARWSLFGGGIVITYPLWISFFNTQYFDKTPRPDRTIIVTGATGRLGSSTTYHLAKRKCRVIMACRNMDKCKSIRRELVLSTRNKGIVCRHLDLEDIESINKFAEDVIENEPHIDVLINNAAVIDLKQKELTKYGIEKNLFVNFLAPYLLTLKLMPKLEESAKITFDSRVVNVIGNPKKSWHIDLLDINFEKRKYTRDAAYNQSKLALAYFSILLEKFNRNKRNQVYVFGTSPSATKILPDFNHETGLWCEMKRAAKEYHYQNATRVCQRTVRCALDPQLVKDEQSGKLYDRFLGSWGSNDGWGIAAMNEEKAKLVWNLAANMLLNAREPPPVKQEDTNSKQTPAHSTKREAEGNHQLKVQENNKPSGVDESA